MSEYKRQKICENPEEDDAIEGSSNNIKCLEHARTSIENFGDPVTQNVVQNVIKDEPDQTVYKDFKNLYND